MFKVVLKPLDTFGTEKKKKVDIFTNNLQGLQKVMVKDSSWNRSPWNALLFEKKLKQYQFSIARIADFFKHMSWHGELCGNQGWVFPLFSPDSNDRLSLNFHRFVILYISCDTRSVGLGQSCLYRKCPMALKGILLMKVVQLYKVQGWDCSAFWLNSDFFCQPGKENQTLFVSTNKEILMPFLLFGNDNDNDNDNW